MKLTKLSAKDFKPLKCAIHRTGKLGFTMLTAETLELSSGNGLIFYQNNDMLAIEIVESVNEDAFKIVKAGAYFYCNCKAVFNLLKIEFVNESTIFYMNIITCEGKKLWGLTPRKLKRRSKAKGEKQ